MGQQVSLCSFEFSTGLRLGEAGSGRGTELGPSRPSYTLLTLALFLGRRGLVLAAIGGCWLGCRARAAAGRWQEVG